MSGHAEVRPGRAPGSNGRTETPHDHITAEAAAYEHGTPVQVSPDNCQYLTRQC
jgi:hypothetical protein